MVFERNMLTDIRPVDPDDASKNVTYNGASCDVCIVCPTVKDVKVLIDEIGLHWHLTFKRMYSYHGNIEYYRTSMYNLKGEALIINISWQLKHGPQAAASHLDLIIREFHPRLVALGGVCAGDRRKVKLGDLVVASSTFSYNDQFTEKSDNLQKCQPVIDLSYLNPKIKFFIENFDEWKEAIIKLKKVHPMYQENKMDSNDITDNILFNNRNTSDRDRDQYISTCKRSIQKLRTKIGSYYKKYRLFTYKTKSVNFNSEGSNSETQPYLHSELYVAPMALVNRVRRDDPFDGIQKLVSETIALDMEAGAFYRTAENFPTIYALVVKGIADYADREKDDKYHKYASSLSAMYIVHFISKYVTSDMMVDG